MQDSKQKYLLEPYLLLSSKEFVLMRPSDDSDFFDGLLPHVQDIINKTNIYFICKKPRIRFIEESLFYNNHILQLGFELTTKNGLKREMGVLHNSQAFFPKAISFAVHTERKSKLVVTYPNNASLTYMIEDIFPLFYFSCAFSSFSNCEVLDYDVLYIGQSTGNKIPSNAYKRIQKHEKLQKILSDLSENEPYNELLILMVTLDNPTLFGISDHRFSDDSETNNIDSIRHHIFDDKLSKKEIVNIAECCLIKYFSPSYNIMLKNNISSGAEKFLQKCRKYDINSVSVIIDTSIKAINLFSPKKESKPTHHAKLKVHFDDNRVGFQEILSHH